MIEEVEKRIEQRPLVLPAGAAEVAEEPAAASDERTSKPVLGVAHPRLAGEEPVNAHLLGEVNDKDGKTWEWFGGVRRSKVTQGIHFCNVIT